MTEMDSIRSTLDLPCTVEIFDFIGVVPPRDRWIYISITIDVVLRFEWGRERMYTPFPDDNTFPYRLVFDFQVDLAA